jgi:general secretion pathway protein K
LAEPWAVPLEEARLSSFLAVDGTTSDTDTDAFLSGSIIDMQSRLNVVNLVDGAALSETGFASFQRLFDRLDLSPQTLKTFADNYLEATKKANAASAVTSANQADWLLPQRPDQLAWLGLDATTLAVLAPHITILPARTSIPLARWCWSAALRDWTWQEPKN